MVFDEDMVTQVDNVYRSKRVMKRVRARPEVLDAYYSYRKSEFSLEENA